MKLFKYTIMALALAGAFTSCSDDDEDYTPGPQSAGVYFPSTDATSYKLTTDGTSFDVTVARTDASAAGSYAVSSDANPEYFTVPSSVNFAAGESKATLTINYDGEALGFDNRQDIKLTLSESESMAYGNGTLAISVIIPQPWSTIGTGTMTEDFLTTFFSIEPTTYEVEVQENDLTPGYYRIVNPLTNENYPYYTPGDETDPDATGYIYLNATNPNEVYMPISDTNCNWSDGNISLMSFGYYYMQKGEEVDPSYWGKLEDGIISFPAGSCLIQMIDYSTGWYISNSNGAFRLYLPGVVVKDYTAEIAYKGLYQDGETEEYSAVVNINVGTDVTNAKVGIMATRNESDVLQAMLNEEIDTYDFGAGFEQIAQLPVSESGYYTAAIIAYDGEEAMGATSCTFKITIGGGEPELTWDYIATGTYTYVNLFEGDDPDLEMFECVENPDLFKIEHWGYDVDFYFTWTEDGVITVQDQYIGYTHDSYGEVWVMELGDYVGSTEMGWSEYSSGVFTFNTIYYFSAGYFGYGPEEFVLTAVAGNAPQKVVAAQKAAAKRKVKSANLESVKIQGFDRKSPLSMQRLNYIKNNVTPIN